MLVARSLLIAGNIRWRVLPRLLLATLSLVPVGCADHAPPALSSAPTVEWAATEDLRIGSVDDSASALTKVGSLAIDSGGRIYVSQPMDQTIRVFDATGHRVGTFGRPGDGPGEFREVSEIGILRDTLYASDRVTGRVTFFSLDGQLLGTLPLVPRGLDTEWYPLVPGWLAADGTALSLTASVSVVRDPKASLRALFVRIDRSGGIIDTAAFWVRSPEQTIRLRGPYGPQIMNQPFSGSLSPTVSADGSRVAVVGDDGPAGDRATFHVTVARSTRDTVWSHSYDYDPIPASGTIVDSTVAAAAGRLNPEAFPDRADAERQIREGMSVPDHLAPVSDGVFADDGDLWLRREDVPGRDQRWTVLDSTGAPGARITLPRGLKVEVIRSSTLWGVETDELGVPYVVRYTITR